MATQADLDRLKNARNRGILTVDYEGIGRITYPDMDSLRKAIADVERDLAVASGQHKISQSFASFSRG